MTIEKLLYHGSGFDQPELMPGFLRTGKLVEWDKVENNHWLYTTTDRNEAIAMAFASMIEKTYGSTEYERKGNSIRVRFPMEVTPSLDELKKLQLYLYTIRLDEADGWVKNANEHNQIKTEWKTQNIVDKNILHKEQVDLVHWLANKRVELRGGGKGDVGMPNFLVAW
jgi:guanylate kinase